MPHRIIDIPDGMVMAVTDLHGDWPLYARYRDIFLHLFERGLVQSFVVTGDFIHSDGPAEQDGSLNIVLDLIALRESYGDAIVVLLGNHEMPHIYSTTLQRGEHVYTPRFEHALGDHREAILSILMDLPFFARTPAGVSLCHAGAFPGIRLEPSMNKLASFSHRKLLQHARDELKTLSRERLRERISRQMYMPYADFVETYFAVKGKDDPRYDAYLVGQQVSATPKFNLLWDVLFSRNEHAFNMHAYAGEVQLLLQALSQNTAPQRALISGHIGCRGGARIIADGRQLRLASGAHAHPYESAKYVIFDAEKPIDSAEDLLVGLGSVFEE